MNGARAVDDNLRESFRLLARGRPCGEIRELPGLSIASASTTFQMFNAAFLSAPADTPIELESRIASARVHFDARGLKWSFWLSDHWLGPRARRHAERSMMQYGLHRAVEMPGMTAVSLDPPRRDLPLLDIVRVSSPAHQRAFCEIGAVCFQVPLPWFRDLFERDHLWDHFAGYVAYADSEPVATAAVVTLDHVAGVYNVATLPNHRRRGYGEAIIRHALLDAGPAWRATVLQATESGRPLYEAMGYSGVTKVTVFAS